MDDLVQQFVVLFEVQLWCFDGELVYFVQWCCDGCYVVGQVLGQFVLDVGQMFGYLLVGLVEIGVVFEVDGDV